MDSENAALPKAELMDQNDQPSTFSKETLNAAWMATFNRVAFSDAAKAWVDDVVSRTLAFETKYHPRERTRRKTDHESFVRAVGAFAADLLRHTLNEKADGFMYRSSDRDELALTLVSSTNFDQLVILWAEMDLMEVTGYIDARDDFDGTKIVHYQKARRFRPSPAFVALASEHGIQAPEIKDHFQTSYRHTNVVQVRATKNSDQVHTSRGKLIRQKGPRFDVECDRVRRLNLHLAEHEYSLSSKPMVRRVFNCGDRLGFNFNLGGRFYSASEHNWMEMPKEERALILIDGAETSEIDVRASHLSILYALSGALLANNRDPYWVEDYPRPIIKKLIVATIGGGKMPTKWPKGFNEEFATEHGYQPRNRFKLKDVVEAINAKHPVLDNLEKGKLDWANLQFEEAECFMSAMMELHENHGIASLPVHDSLIVRKMDIGPAKSALATAYETRLGFQPVLKVPGVNFENMAA